jgi:hypothetical protein
LKCLIDTDVVLYEACFGGEYRDEDTGEKIVRDFEPVASLFDQKIKEIEDACWADEDSDLFLTGNAFLLRLENRKRKREGLEALPLVPNFRFQVAKATPYKDKRSERPYHYYNLLAYIHHHYSPLIAWGIEADDLLCIHQQRFLKEESTIICSRDKDLRIMPGWQYGWECGSQPGFGPLLVDSLGTLGHSEKGKITGTGLKFFYSQMITGDKVDTIPGLPRGGPVMAYKALSECETEVAMYRAVKALYEAKGYGVDYFLEQAYLLWMVRDVDDEGNPMMYQLPEEW